MAVPPHYVVGGPEKRDSGGMAIWYSSWQKGLLWFSRWNSLAGMGWWGTLFSSHRGSFHQQSIPDQVWTVDASSLPILRIIVPTKRFILKVHHLLVWIKSSPSMITAFFSFRFFIFGPKLGYQKNHRCSHMQYWNHLGTYNLGYLQIFPSNGGITGPNLGCWIDIRLRNLKWLAEFLKQEEYGKLNLYTDNHHPFRHKNFLNVGMVDGPDFAGKVAIVASFVAFLVPRPSASHKNTQQVWHW